MPAGTCRRLAEAALPCGRCQKIRLNGPLDSVLKATSIAMPERRPRWFRGIPREFAYFAATPVTMAGLDSRVRCTGHLSAISTILAASPASI